jgi:hypothetical protein
MIAPVVASDWPTLGMLVSRSQKKSPMFEVTLRKRGRTRWEWRVCDSTGREIMQGWETSRPAARYKGERALFLLLLAPVPSHTLQPRSPTQPPRPRARTRIPPS